MSRRTTHIKTKFNSNKKRYYRNIKYPEIPLSFNDIYVLTTAGDRLDNIANQFYEDVDLWWIISTANPDVIRRDSFNLKPGLEIRIPQDIDNILEDFEQINKFSLIEEQKLVQVEDRKAEIGKPLIATFSPGNEL